MSDAELDAKFMELTCRVLPREQAASALNLLWRTEEMSNISSLFDAVRAPD
jgi:hypothetical protein